MMQTTVSVRSGSQPKAYNRLKTRGITLFQKIRLWLLNCGVVKLCRWYSNLSSTERGYLWKNMVRYMDRTGHRVLFEIAFCSLCIAVFFSATVLLTICCGWILENCATP